MANRAIRGTHHLTFCVGGQEDYDFHVRLLGLGVKKTVLFDGEIDLPPVLRQPRVTRHLLTSFPIAGPVG
jgi:hypothetical protein